MLHRRPECINPKRKDLVTRGDCCNASAHHHRFRERSFLLLFLECFLSIPSQRTQACSSSCGREKRASSPRTLALLFSMCGQFPFGEYSLAPLSILSLWPISSQRTVFCSLAEVFFFVHCSCDELVETASSVSLSTANTPWPWERREELFLECFFFLRGFGNRCGGGGGGCAIVRRDTCGMPIRPLSSPSHDRLHTPKQEPVSGSVSSPSNKIRHSSSKHKKQLQHDKRSSSKVSAGAEESDNVTAALTWKEQLGQILAILVVATLVYYSTSVTIQGLQEASKPFCDDKESPQATVSGMIVLLLLLP